MAHGLVQNQFITKWPIYRNLVPTAFFARPLSLAEKSPGKEVDKFGPYWMTHLALDQMHTERNFDLFSVITFHSFFEAC